MSEQTNLDFSAIEAPISPEAAAGRNIRWEPIYDQIAEARREDDGLPAGDWGREPRVANWREVIRLCNEALSRQTKDLQVAAYLTEASTRLFGFTGLTDGLHIIRILHELFWDSMFPLPDGGDQASSGGQPEAKPPDYEARERILEWLDQELSIAVLHIPLLKGERGLGLYEHDQAAEVENAELKKAGTKALLVAEGKTCREELENAYRSTSTADLRELRRLVDRTWDEFQRLQPVLNEKHGGTGSMIKLHTALERCRNLVGRWADQRRQEEPEAEPDAAVEEGADAEHAAGRAPWSGGQPRSRGEAYLMLKTAAAYLRSTEPHSPVSYLVERAIRWGGCSWTTC